MISLSIREQRLGGNIDTKDGGCLRLVGDREIGMIDTDASRKKIYKLNLALSRRDAVSLLENDITC